MNPTSYPEANRLVYRVRAAITGESTGFETAKLAWQQAEAVARANADLKRAEAALQKDSLLDCLLIERHHPSLLETAESLNHPLVDAWKQRCETYSWRVPEPVDLETASKIRSAIDEVEDLKEWLYNEYRSAVRAKDPFLAYKIIELIAARYPDDPNATQEAASRQKQLVDQATVEVKDALEQLIPKEEPKKIARRYLDLGLPLEASSNSTVINTIASTAAERANDFADKMRAVISDAKDLHENENWQEVEKAYLACDYTLVINEARGEVDTALRADFERVATELSRIRSKYESSISIRLAIGELHNGKESKGKSVPLANRVEKLRSLENQALKTGSQIAEDLQKEIKDAYATARRKRIPAFAMIAAAAFVGLAVVIFLIQRNQERAEQAGFRNRALAALQETERSGSVSETRDALEKWNQAIESAQPNSSLATQAEILEAWLASQVDLSSEYTDAIQRLEETLQEGDALSRGDEISSLIANIQKTRSDLAPDLGREFDNRFASAVQKWSQEIEAAEESRSQELAQLQRELNIATRNAGQAKTRSEFERLKSAAETRIQRISSLLQADPSASSATQLKTLAQSAEQQLAEMETKWAALESAWQQLGQTASLNNYLEQLERIHSFDILPPEQKNAIDQTLRLRSAFSNLKSEILIPGDQAAAEFLAGQDYATDQPKLTAEETAYLERLLNLDAFSQIYQSTVEYFEGSADPLSEYTIFLVEPISKSDSQENESHITFTFRVRGFDEFGNPEPEPNEVQFISRADGSFWGFFYKPSTLSPESNYFQNSIQNNLNLALAGGDRFAIIRLIEALDKQDDLSPAYRVYWQQELIGFMQLQPWKWGLALSPTLQKRASQLASLPSGELSERLWLSTIEQTVPSPEYQTLVETPVGERAQKEAATLAGLYRDALGGSFNLAGAVLADGEPRLFQDSQPETPLWTVNSLTGRVERLEATTELTPYAPILYYQLPSGNSPQELLEQAEAASGLNLSEPPFASLLPALLR